MNSVISYKGEVIVTTDGKNSTTRKNTGTFRLFEVLCNILAGAYNDSSKGKDKLYDSIPQYINVYQTTNNQIDKTKKVNLSPIPIINRKVYKEEKSATVSLYATLHNMNTSDTEILCNELVLELVDDNQQALAKVFYDATNFIDLADNNSNYSQCTIEWKLTFGNYTQNTD